MPLPFKVLSQLYAIRKDMKSVLTCLKFSREQQE